MQSNGGLMPAAEAAARPVHIIEMRPGRRRDRRAGAGAADRAAQAIITFDMGGTTAKASMIEDGEVTRAGGILRSAAAS